MGCLFSSTLLSSNWILLNASLSSPGTARTMNFLLLFWRIQEWTSQFAAVFTGFHVHGRTLPGTNFSSIHPAVKIRYTDFKQTLGTTYITGLLCVTLLKLIWCLGSLGKKNKKKKKIILYRKRVLGNQRNKFKRKILLLSSSISETSNLIEITVWEIASQEKKNTALILYYRTIKSTYICYLNHFLSFLCTITFKI